jgi:hypothetical protein
MVLILRLGSQPDVYWRQFEGLMARTKVTSRKGRPAQTVLSGARPAQASSRPRPWKSSDAADAARAFFARPRPRAARDLLRSLCSGDPYQHRCAAEVARLISRRQPGLLAAYGDLLAEVAAGLPEAEWQSRGYILVAAALNATTTSQRNRLLPLVRARLEEDRIAVRAMALEAFACLAAPEPDLRDEALTLLEAAGHSAVPALRSRAKLMLPILLKAEARTTR